MKKLILMLAISAALFACSDSNKSCEKECAKAECDTEKSVIRLNVFYTPNDSADINTIKELADSLVAASRTDVGCISYDFFESTTTPGSYIIVETWENDSLLNIHSNAPHFVKYVPQLNALGTMDTQRFAICK